MVCLFEALHLADITTWYYYHHHYYFHFYFYCSFHFCLFEATHYCWYFTTPTTLCMILHFKWFACLERFTWLTTPGSLFLPSSVSQCHFRWNIFFWRTRQSTELEKSFVCSSPLPDRKIFTMSSQQQLVYLQHFDNNLLGQRPIDPWFSGSSGGNDSNSSWLASFMDHRSWSPKQSL